MARLAQTRLALLSRLLETGLPAIWLLHPRWTLLLARASQVAPLNDHLPADVPRREGTLHEAAIARGLDR